MLVRSKSAGRSESGRRRRRHRLRRLPGKGAALLTGYLAVAGAWLGRDGLPRDGGMS